MPYKKQAWLQCEQLDIDSPTGIYQSVIVPFFDTEPIQYFEGMNHIKLAYKAFCQSIPSKALVIVNGRTESIVKYQELIYEFFQRGYSVYCFDLRGQGFSERPCANPRMGDIDNIDYYIEDLDRFVSTIISKNHTDYHIVGHSTGGSILIRYLALKQHPFNKAVLSVPMVEPRILNRPFTHFSTHITLPISRLFNNYVLTRGPYRDLDEDGYSPIRHNSDRHRLICRIYRCEPQIQLGGPSRRWLYQWTRVSREMIKSAEKITIPVLLLKAEHEFAVNNGAIDAFIKRFEYNENARLTTAFFAGARHELFHESDEYRNKVLDTVWTFLN